MNRFAAAGAMHHCSGAVNHCSLQCYTSVRVCFLPKDSLSHMLCGSCMISYKLQFAPLDSVHFVCIAIHVCSHPDIGIT